MAMGPNSFDSYQLACAYAKLSDTENALRNLDYSLKHGYASKDQIERDTDFDKIRSNDKFKELMAALK